MLQPGLEDNIWSLLSANTMFKWLHACFNSHLYGVFEKAMMSLKWLFLKEVCHYIVNIFFHGPKSDTQSYDDLDFDDVESKLF